jgi:hypothetical protein
MMPILIGLAVLVLVLRWRVMRHKHRTLEQQSFQLAHRPMNEFDARFPADRRQGRGLGGRRYRKRLGF